VVGGPLRTGRRTELARVIRVGVAPHGALTGGALVDGEGHVLGVVTGTAIRGTTVVVPASIAWAEVQEVLAHEGAAPGYLGIGSVPVSLAAAQQAAGHAAGLLVTAVADGGPAATAGVLVGDVVVAFDGAPVDDPEHLVARLRGRAGQAVALTLVRGGAATTLTITVGERPRG
jgi:S1-C subfamily serine protease